MLQGAGIDLPQACGSRQQATLLGENMNPQDRTHPGWNWWYLLFLVQYVAVLWPPFFNRAEPSWIGMPFFYWYQLLWIILGAILTAIVYFVTDD
jgi:Protein of unknown function (DUF3311)